MRSEPVLIICVVLFVLRLNNEWVRSCMRKYYELSVYDYVYCTTPYFYHHTSYYTLSYYYY